MIAASEMSRFKRVIRKHRISGTRSFFSRSARVGNT